MELHESKASSDLDPGAAFVGGALPAHDDARWPRGLSHVPLREAGSVRGPWLAQPVETPQGLRISS